MSKARDNFIKMMREEKKWIVVPVGIGNVAMHRKIGKHRISVHLEGISNGTFKITPANYIFKSRASHFDYTHTETRWSRNKGTFKAILDSLKASRAISFIENLDDFIQVNPYNKKSDKRKANSELSELLDERVELKSKKNAAA